MHPITEATLEMHFHSALMDLFRSTIGLGASGAVNFYKYAPYYEKFVGFDQAYVRTELSPPALYRALRSIIDNPRKSPPIKIAGYFLQFKVVHVLQRSSRAMPTGFSAAYYRAELRTQRKKANDLAQHEILFSLSANRGALVYYACPMVFDQAELYRPVADLDQLRLADVSSAPSAFNDNAVHTVCFQTKISEPKWCSDPADGKSIPPREFVARLVVTLRSPEELQANARVLLEVLQRHERVESASDASSLSSLAESLTLVSVKD